MSVIYENPPLVEALCDIFFQPSKQWDVTVPGLFYNEIRPDFGIDEAPEQSSESDSSDREGKVGSEEDFSERPVSFGSRFKSQDGNRFVQLYPDHMTVNFLGPAYNGWNDFKEKVLAIIAKYDDIARPSGIKELSLRYVNRFYIPVGEDGVVSIGSYFTISPKIPNLPGIRSGYLVKVELLLPQGMMTVQNTLPAAQDLNDLNNKIASVFLDLELAHNANKELMRLGEIEAWLESGHSQIEEIFQSCITPICEQRFGKKTEKMDDDVKIN